MAVLVTSISGLIFVKWEELEMHLPYLCMSMADMRRLWAESA